MALILTLYLPAAQPDPDPDSLAAAFGVPGDGSDAFEIGRAETGSACMIARDPALPSPAAPADRRASPWRLVVPTLRAPWSARDLLPTCAHAAALVGGTWGPKEGTDELDLLNAWDEAHAREVSALALTCEATGVAPPPFREAAALDDVHRWLLAIAEREPEPGLFVPAHIHALDPADGGPTLFAVRFPQEGERAFLPLVDGLLFDPTGGEGGLERPLLYPRSLIGTGPIVDVQVARRALIESEGEAIARFRFVTPVEVIDEESLKAPSGSAPG